MKTSLATQGNRAATDLLLSRSVSLMNDNKSYTEAFAFIHDRFYKCDSHSHFLRLIHEEIKQFRSSDVDVIARNVLGY